MEERCICCGEIIPEGRQVCINCEVKSYVGKIRFLLINKGKHRKKRREIPDTMYVGPEQWLLLTSNQKWRGKVR